MDQPSNNHIKGVIEALLFVNERPITFQQIKEILAGVEVSDIKICLNELKNEYEERKSGMVLAEIAGGYQMLSNSLYASYLRSFYKTKHKEKLSKPSLETLAIVAYKQPVTRADVELIRGVNSDGVVAHLVNKELIKIIGRKDVPGRPYLYGTTKQFQEYFGLKSLSDLPKLEDFPKLALPDEDAPIIIEEDQSELSAESSVEPDQPQQSSGSDEPSAEEPAEGVADIQGGEQVDQAEPVEVKDQAEPVEVKEQTEQSEQIAEGSPAETDPVPEPVEQTAETNNPMEEEVVSSPTIEERVNDESCETSQKDQ